MKSLTICQPYATAIMLGLKTVENRTWPTRERGRILIHAGKSLAYLQDAYRSWGSALNHEALPHPWELTLPYGAILGTVDLIDCVDRAHGIGFDSTFATGPWCFVLANPRPFVQPVPYRGAQGFFEVPPQAIGGIAA